MRLAFLVFALSATAQAQVAPSAMSIGVNGNFNGYIVSPGSAWYTVVTNASVDPNSAAWVNENSGYNLHPDFSIPYNVVNEATAPKYVLPINAYVSDTDQIVQSIPAGVAIEGPPPECTTNPGEDYHMILIYVPSGMSVENWQALPCKGQYSASNYALWDTTKNTQRPWGFTSADAAGLEMLPGLATYEQAYQATVPQQLNGATVQTLGHAIRFVANHLKGGNSPTSGAYGGLFVLPATHAAFNNSGTNNIMGMRIRLKASFDTSPYSGGSLVLLNTMKTYGMILADIGGNGFFSGTSDSRWSDADNNALKAVSLSNFEVMTEGPVYAADSIPPGNPPTITTPVAMPSTLLLGQCASVAWTSTGGSVDYLQVGAPKESAAQQVCPTSTTSYTANSNNLYGRTTSAPVTITVKVPPFVGQPPIGTVRH